MRIMTVLQEQDNLRQEPLSHCEPAVELLNCCLKNTLRETTVRCVSVRVQFVRECVDAVQTLCVCVCVYVCVCMCVCAR